MRRASGPVALRRCPVGREGGRETLASYPGLLTPASRYVPARDQFYQEFPRVSMQATNAGVRRPGPFDDSISHKRTTQERPAAGGCKDLVQPSSDNGC